MIKVSEILKIADRQNGDPCGDILKLLEQEYKRMEKASRLMGIDEEHIRIVENDMGPNYELISDIGYTYVTPNADAVYIGGNNNNTQFIDCEMRHSKSYDNKQYLISSIAYELKGIFDIKEIEFIKTYNGSKNRTVIRGIGTIQRLITYSNIELLETTNTVNIGNVDVIKYGNKPFNLISLWINSDAKVVLDSRRIVVAKSYMASAALVWSDSSHRVMELSRIIDMIDDEMVVEMVEQAWDSMDVDDEMTSPVIRFSNEPEGIFVTYESFLVVGEKERGIEIGNSLKDECIEEFLETFQACSCDKNLLEHLSYKE